MSAPRQLPSGKWFIRWIDETGKQVGKAYETKAQAVAGARKGEVARDAVRAGLARPRSAQTVTEASQGWLATRSPDRRVDNEMHLRVHILPFMGNKRLIEVTPELVQTFIRHMEAKSTSWTLAKSQRPIRPRTIKNVLI